jgi:hypothetical protein
LKQHHSELSPQLVPSSPKARGDNDTEASGLGKDFVKAFLRLHYLLGFRSSERSRQIFSLSVRARFQDLPPFLAVEVVKVLTAHPMAVLLGNEPPSMGLELEALMSRWGCTTTPWRFLVPGKIGSDLNYLLRRSAAILRNRDCLNRRLRLRVEVGLRFAASFLQLKRSMPDLGPSFEKVALAKHRASLSEVVPTDRQTLQFCLDVVDRLFSKGRVEVDWSDEMASPSASACSDRRRGDGGVQKFLSDWSTPFGERSNILMTPAGCAVEIPRNLSGLRFNRAIEHYAEKMLGEKRYCRVTSVSDPLKVRIVTTTPGTDALLVPLQRGIHSAMRAMKPFQLIGEWVSGRHLEEILGSQGFFNSGDYSCATDGISSELSQAVLDRVLGYCDPVNEDQRLTHDLMVKVARRTLTGNTLVYPDGDEVLQRSGQLMGSHLSFPLLCLINFSIWMLSRKPPSTSNRKFLWSVKLKDLPVRINGDDIISWETSESYTRWRGAVERAHWSLSVGKCYSHPLVGVINSQTYLRTGPGKVVLVPYVNLRFLRSRDKFGVVKNYGDEELGERATAFVASCPSRRRAMSLFVSTFRHLLGRTPRPLFVPIRFGGLGGRVEHAQIFREWFERIPLGIRFVLRAISDGEPPPFTGSRTSVRGSEEFVRRACDQIFGHRLYRRWGEVGEEETLVEQTMAKLRSTFGQFNQRGGVVSRRLMCAAWFPGHTGSVLESTSVKVGPSVDFDLFWSFRRRSAFVSNKRPLAWTKAFFSPKRRLVWDFSPGEGFVVTDHRIEPRLVQEEPVDPWVQVLPERAGLGFGTRRCPLDLNGDMD